MEGWGEQKNICKACGKPVTGDIQPDARGDVFCRQCAIEQLEKDLWQTPEEMPNVKHTRMTGTWRIVMIIFVILSMGIIAYQTPKLLSAFKNPKPVRMGTYETDETTDRCIRNLWQQAYLMQQERPDDARYIVCPATGRPYVFKRGPNQEVHCPNPDRHGFRDIVVTKKNPVPELR
jgi:hypothetical protein